jgi:hypothetical protein
MKIIRFIGLFIYLAIAFLGLGIELLVYKVFSKKRYYKTLAQFDRL